MSEEHPMLAWCLDPGGSRQFLLSTRFPNTNYDFVARDASRPDRALIHWLTHIPGHWDRHGDVFCFSLSFTLHKCLAKENSRAAQTDSREYIYITSSRRMIQSLNKTGWKQDNMAMKALRRPHFKEKWIRYPKIRWGLIRVASSGTWLKMLNVCFHDSNLQKYAGMYSRGFTRKCFT